jgi:hypothetical protein
MTGNKSDLLRYNAKSGKWKIDEDLVDKISFIADMDHAEAGWSKFKEREAPSFVMVKVTDLLNGTPYPAAIDGYDKAFRVRVKLTDQLAKGRPSVREFSSSSFIVLRSFDSLFDQWHAERDKQPGKVPVVAVDSYEEIDGKFGVNMAPVFRIKSWVDRPRDLPDGAMAQPTPANPPVVKEGLKRAKKALDDLDDEIPF